MSRAIECPSGYDRSDSHSLACAFRYVRGMMVPHLSSALYVKGRVCNPFQLSLMEHWEQVREPLLSKRFNEDGIAVLLLRLLQ